MGSEGRIAGGHKPAVDRPPPTGRAPLPTRALSARPVPSPQLPFRACPNPQPRQARRAVAGLPSARHGHGLNNPSVCCTCVQSQDDRTTRAVIRDEALCLFAAHGPESVTVRQIASAASVSPGLVVHHFAPKGEFTADDTVVVRKGSSTSDEVCREAG
ncbi:TetR family transcriptional regulator [Streptomyces sp. NPDC093261]|uniref:TetR/AcrR family transcriptional regulator n=1 Tax=Streptomyces sp. NPDC093261 TaxID=3366037 RepID=UPI003802A76E